MKNENTNIKRIEVGTILEGDFGATMQLPAFYKVVAITASGKSAKVRRMATANVTSDGGWTGTCVPDESCWHRADAGVETKRIHLASWDCRNPYEYVTIRGHMFHPWDGEPAYFDHWD